MELRVTRVRKIHSDGRHNAFTGLAAFRGRYYVCFRTGKTHGAPGGGITVIASHDLSTWTKVHEIAAGPARDLRDPKLVTFNGQLLVIYGANTASGVESRICRSRDGAAFDPPETVTGFPPNHWLWHVRPHAGRLYGSAYCAWGEGTESALIGRSEEGSRWEKLLAIPVPGANEMYLDFDSDGRLWALVRQDRLGTVPALCVAEPPYETLKSIRYLPLRMQGPMLARLRTGCLIACRQWDQPGRRNLRTELFWLGDGQDLRRLCTLPSGGDTSYASWLDLGAGRALLSYYSAHEHKMDEPHSNDGIFAATWDEAYAEHSSGADIFLAEISYRE